MNLQHFHCVELVSGKSEIPSYPTRWGAAIRCHDLNKWNPQERWTVRQMGDFVKFCEQYDKEADK